MHVGVEERRTQVECVVYGGSSRDRADAHGHDHIRARS